MTDTMPCATPTPPAVDDSAAGRAPGRTVRRHRPVRRFLWHLLEMAVAMVAGTVLLTPLREAVRLAIGTPGALARPGLDALAVATSMVAGMAVWMRVRRHGWPAIVEMGAAMYAPYALLLVPFWLGVLPSAAMLDSGHLLTLPAMVLAMLRRPGEYTAHRPLAVPACPDPAAGRVQRLATVLRRRWPTWVALLITIDLWFAPIVPAAWLLLVLPLAYLAIGALRRQLGRPRVLALQVGGLLAYLGLIVAAVAAGGEPARYLVAAGWLAHAVWDVAHHRADRVVPRPYAEFCAALDLVVGLTILLV